jgi:hypothetical protein
MHKELMLALSMCRRYLSKHNHMDLKVVGNKKGGGLVGCLLFKDGFGLRCLFALYLCCRLFFNEFPFLFCKDQLIGDWLENRQGARNTIILLIIRQY